MKQHEISVIQLTVFFYFFISVGIVYHFRECIYLINKVMFIADVLKTDMRGYVSLKSNIITTVAVSEFYELTNKLKMVLGYCEMEQDFFFFCLKGILEINVQCCY